MSSKPAKLAGISIVVIGVALFAVSIYYSARALIEPAWLDAQLDAAGPMLQDNPMLRPPALTWIVILSGVLGLLESGLSVILGIYTYLGKRWAIITSIVLSALRLLIVGLLLLLVVLAASLAPSPTDTSVNLLFAGGSTLVLLALIGLLIAALWKAPRDQPSTSNNQRPTSKDGKSGLAHFGG